MVLLGADLLPGKGGFDPETFDFFGAAPPANVCINVIDNGGPPGCAAVPEPATAALLALGLTGLAARGARRRTR